MILADNSLKLIDLELSGFNYRGFDLMKLYRADRAVFSVRTLLQHHIPIDFPCNEQEESFFKFLYEYHAEFNLLNNKTKKNIRAEVEQLALECRIFEPLTWLEAAIFFIFLVCASDKMEIETRQANLLLFSERWLAYQESRWLLNHCTS